MSNRMLSISPSIDYGITGTPKELRSLYFFSSETVPQLSGVFGSSFWKKSILQTSRYEPAVKHAAIALGAFHENATFENNDSRDKDSRLFAAEHYLKAISYLVKSDKPQTLDVYLMTCAMFICFEVMLLRPVLVH